MNEMLYVLQKECLCCVVVDGLRKIWGLLELHQVAQTHLFLVIHYILAMLQQSVRGEVLELLFHILAQWHGRT